MQPRRPRFVSGRAAGRRAKPVECDGHRFPSRHERDRYLHLKLLQKQGLIWGLELQPCYDIVVNGEPLYLSPPGTRGRRPLSYRADFRYFDDAGLHVEDAKGVRTKEYLIKKALVEAIYKITITEV